MVITSWHLLAKKSGIVNFFDDKYQDKTADGETSSMFFAFHQCEPNWFGPFCDLNVEGTSSYLPQATEINVRNQEVFEKMGIRSFPRLDTIKIFKLQHGEKT